MKKLVYIFCLILIISSLTLCVSINLTDNIKVDAVSNSRQLTILMYHSVLKSNCGKYTVHPDVFEKDLRELRDNGYTTVFLSEVIGFVDGKNDLPEKPIVITFDDGHYNNLYYALPLLKKYNMKAVLSVIGSFSAFSNDSGDDSNPCYSYLTWNQIKQLAQSGHFEIGNHTYNMHKFSPRYGMLPMTDEAPNDYEQVVKKDILRLQNILSEKCAITPVVFAYPFGRYKQSTAKIVKDLGFRAVLTCCEGKNTITVGDTETLYSLKRYNRSGREGDANMCQNILKLA